MFIDTGFMDRESSQNLGERLTRGSDRIASLILYSDLAWLDIELQINALRELCRDEAPDKVPLFDAIYGQRFVRLWEQWRSSAEAPPF